MSSHFHLWLLLYRMWKACSCITHNMHKIFCAHHLCSSKFKGDTRKRTASHVQGNYTSHIFADLWNQLLLKSITLSPDDFTLMTAVCFQADARSAFKNQVFTLQQIWHLVMLSNRFKRPGKTQSRKNILFEVAGIHRLGKRLSSVYQNTSACLKGQEWSVGKNGGS